LSSTVAAEIRNRLKRSDKGFSLIVAHAFGVTSMKSLPRAMAQSSSYMFSSRSFKVSGLTLWSLIHFEPTSG
jgi:hypothetical protein